MKKFIENQRVVHIPTGRIGNFRDGKSPWIRFDFNDFVFVNLNEVRELTPLELMLE